MPVPRYWNRGFTSISTKVCKTEEQLTMNAPQQINYQVCTRFSGVIAQIGGSVTNYTQCMVIPKEEFELFTGQELNPFSQCFVAIESHYDITTVLAQRFYFYIKNSITAVTTQQLHTREGIFWIEVIANCSSV